MNVHFRLKSHTLGLTLLEMTLVILVLMSLLSVGLFSSKKLTEWRLAREASETLRAVYTAQRMFLADNPTVGIGTITPANIISYLPPKTPIPTTLAAYFGASMPKSLTNDLLDINYTTANSSPFFTKGTVRYDPSGSNTDSLWDVGE
jgi:type II secretory pathway pseudopilin PulG